jgi:hypothetical protein
MPPISVVRVYSPSTQGSEAGGLRAVDQPGLHSETLRLKKKRLLS